MFPKRYADVLIPHPIPMTMNVTCFGNRLCVGVSKLR